jgi:putative transposase
MDYQRDAHRVHVLVYHLLWCPKHRTSALVGPVAARCWEPIAGMCAERGWTILALALQPEHLHLCVQIGPSTSAAEVVKACKGIVPLHLRHADPQLRKLPSLWTRSQFASPAGNVRQETMQWYIAVQTGR